MPSPNRPLLARSSPAGAPEFGGAEGDGTGEGSGLGGDGLSVALVTQKG